MHPETPKQDTQELLLEEILREFGSQMPELTEDPAPVEVEIPDPTGDTIRMEPLQPVTESAPLTDQTAVFAPVAAEEEEEQALPEEAPPAPKPAPAEPYSDEWEPEYEEPMGEYTPKEPIPFPPKNRLRQLRKKLVAGPERRYHALMEDGVGQLQAGIFFSFLIALVSVAGTVACALGYIDPSWLRTVIFCQFLLAMLSALVGCYRLLDGLSSLLHGNFTMDTTLFITFLACIADGLLCLSTQRLSASCLFCLQILMAQAGAYQRRVTEISQMDVLRKASDLTAVVKADGVWNERPAYLTAEGEPESFLDHYRKPSGPEKAMSIHAILSLLASTALSVTLYSQQGLNAAVAIFMAAQLLSRPLSAFVSMSRPTAILQNRLHRLGSVLCGWQGIRAVERNCFYPLRHSDLFPQGAIKMNSVKFYGTVDPGRVVSYTTALLTAEENGLVSVFHQLPRSRGSGEHSIEGFAQQPGGISALVDGWPVIVGTIECMEAFGIEMPAGSKVPQAVYAVVDNQLSGVFAVTYTRSKSSSAGLRTLCGDRRFKPVLAACDFTLTPKFLRSKLSVGVRRVQFPARDVRLALSRIQPSEDATVIALTTKEGLAPKAFALTGARALKHALRTGAFIHILSGVIGLAAVAALALNGGSALLTPVNMLLYTAIWSVPGLLITESTRHI